MKILTMAVISKPLAPEADRMKYADEGFNRLSEHVDTWIVVPHAGFVENSGDEVNAQEACMADYHLMYEVVAGITEVITVDGMINIDAADVSLIMSKSGRCLMGKAAASGPGRARTAARCAIEKMGMTGAKGILLNITSNNSLRLKELAVVLECIKFTAPEATIIFGAGIDETMGEEMNVAVYATGFGVS